MQFLSQSLTQSFYLFSHSITIIENLEKFILSGMYLQAKTMGQKNVHGCNG
jgi:hypothetical protein